MLTRLLRALRWHHVVYLNPDGSPYGFTAPMTRAKARETAARFGGGL